MTPAAFVAKWRGVTLTERSASQAHFIDLCRMLGQPNPIEADPTGEEYAFEFGVSVTGPASATSSGQRGFADVAWRGKFAWEYKRRGKHATLDDAYRQLLQYHENLDQPPLLIVCDIERIEIHTKFPGTASTTYTIHINDLAEPQHLERLRATFTNPEGFRPRLTTEQITKDVAADFSKLAEGLRNRGHDPHDAAHFLMKCMFCLFAEDVGLLPKDLFTRTVKAWQERPSELPPRLDDLFAAMADGGAFGADPVAYFNGGLFSRNDAPALELTKSELGILILAGKQDWSAVEPSIFGTLFERSLDPAKRSQIGAHYTSREDILRVIEPVILDPLRREWGQVQERIEKHLESRRTVTTAKARSAADKRIKDDLRGFIERLASVRILDPACGSGNFLFVAIQQLLDLEKEVLTFAARPEIAIPLVPQVRPTQLHGIELSPYAAELAQVVIWIGYLQWMRDNGYRPPSDPILDPLNTIENRDAIISYAGGSEDDPQAAVPATWPDADFIIGNPPFLGSKLFRKHGLPDAYLQAMYSTYELPNTSDLCCYWFERARYVIERWPKTRVGLLATQGIRGGDNRRVLQRIAETGRVFMAWSDLPWVLDGANVHVSIVAFTSREVAGDNQPILDGKPVIKINSNLTGSADLTQAKALPENQHVGWSIGTQKGGAFDISWEQARMLLRVPNPHGRSNSLVVRPWNNASDLVRRSRGMWCVDFSDMLEDEAAKFEAPFAYVRKNVKPERDGNRRRSYRELWWIHQEPRNELRSVLEVPVILITPRVSKYRVWSRSNSITLPDCMLVAFARSDDYFFGVLQSSLHELWGLHQGTRLETRPRYTPTSCFETFALPWSPGGEPHDHLSIHPLYEAIAEAALDLNELRERWLNPPEWIEPLRQQVLATEDFSEVPEDARPALIESAVAAAAAKDARLKKRTLTNLYNQRPDWLKNAHHKLDRAVLAAYAATDANALEGDWDPAWADAWRETGAGQPLPDDASPEAQQARKAADEGVLGALLRLNQERSSA
jgi:hypothetical protein